MVTQLDKQNTTEATPILTVTPGAVSKIKEILAARDLESHALRVFVSGGGCSGLQYGMAIEPEVMEGDTEVAVDGVRLLVDSNSLEYLNGANIDFIDDLMGGGFRIDNPNAVSSCGCGHSFRTEDGQGGGGGCSSCG
ncbi:MAG: iron-sulfur cluster insertion protein ErpA [Anaerolineae bacterium]|nr:iron-sulfur cluster insertion protein ErpA [Anaerolineae bacterium]